MTLPLKILLLHQNFPGQFLHLAPALVSLGHQVVAPGVMRSKIDMPGVRYLRHQPEVPVSPPLPTSLLAAADLESKVCRGESALQALLALHQEGYRPDVVFAHPGWGEALFIKNLFPATRLLIYAEYYYGSPQGDTAFDPEFSKPSLRQNQRNTLKNTHLLHALSECDLAVSPTQFQRSQHPAWAQSKISVIHDGIDGQLIEQEYGIKLPARSVGKYLARWGFTPQRPIKRAYEQNPEAVQAWLQGEYPGIEQRAKREGAEIHWGDETALTNTDVRGRSYAPAGKTPVALAVGGTRQKLSMIATVTNQGKTRWMIIEESFDAEKFCEFLQALIKDAGKKVFLILDNLRVHHSKQVKAWVAERQEQIELFYLPSYSPQLNPEERLNADLKQEMSKRVPVRTKAKLRQAATAHMTMLEQTPERVIGYFQDRHVKYAA